MMIAEKYPPLLILTALPFESRTILEYHDIYLKPVKMTSHRLEKSIYLIETRIAFKFDFSTLKRQIQEISPELIINFGTCGALDRSIPIGSVYYIEEACYPNDELQKIKLPNTIDVFESARLLTVDEPVLDASRRDRLFAETGCRLVDMEAFHIARYCSQQNLPLQIVKVASDWADENSLTAIKANRSGLKRALTDAYEKLLLAI